MVVGAGVVFIAVCAVAASLTPADTGGTHPIFWYSIIPPLLAIVLAFLTRHVIASLGMALIVGGFLCFVPQSPLNPGAWLAGVGATGTCLLDTVTSRGNLLILSFIPPIFMMIQLVIAAGGFQGIIKWVLKWVNGPRSAQLATVLMGILCFIDDYANAIVVGSMMQPVTDRFRISREKLAFLVDATSAPISGLAIISTWIAYEVRLFEGMAETLGVDKNGYSMFFDALHYRFYCLLMLAFIVLIVILGKDFGPMKTAQRKCRAAAEPLSPNGNLPNEPGRKTYALNALIPLGGLIGFHITGLWIDGAGPAKLHAGGSPATWTYWRDVISTAEHSTMILAMAAVFSLILALLCGLATRSLSRPVIGRCLTQGFKRAILPSIILILAWSLKNSCDSLQTGQFLTSLLAERVSPHWFPPILFVIASITSFATGTSWGTMAILIPTAIPIAFALDGDSYGLTTMISLGAVLDGAIFGDHCSPISDTTIISSVATDCDLMDHVKTQLPYSIFVGCIALVFAYLPAAYGLSSVLSLLLGLAVLGAGVAVILKLSGSAS